MATSALTPTWRQMTPNDIKGILHVTGLIHPSLPESDFVFLERMSLFPEGCFVLASSSNDHDDDQSSNIHGYAISHPILMNSPPKLDTLLGSIPTEVDNSKSQFYLHDVAILPEWRGKGFAKECISRLLGIAERRGHETTCLVSVYGTGAFWGQYGFVRPEKVDEALEKKVRGYGGDAVFLVRRNNV